MFNPESPLLNIPANLNRRQAFFFDGMRHAFEIANFAFDRLSRNLAKLAACNDRGDRPVGYSEYYLDAWAFVDSVDRLLLLWKMQPHTDGIPEEWNPAKLSKELCSIRYVRNVLDHLAQRADQVISSGTSAMGELSWINVIKMDPPEMKSYLIRPGFLASSVKFKINIPKTDYIVRNGTANILLKAHEYTADLSLAYAKVYNLARYVEFSVGLQFSSVKAGASIGGDLIASCELNFPKS